MEYAADMRRAVRRHQDALLTCLYGGGHDFGLIVSGAAATQVGGRQRQLTALPRLCSAPHHQRRHSFHPTPQDYLDQGASFSLDRLFRDTRGCHHAADGGGGEQRWGGGGEVQRWGGGRGTRRLCPPSPTPSARAPCALQGKPPTNPFHCNLAALLCQMLAAAVEERRSVKVFIVDVDMPAAMSPNSWPLPCRQVSRASWWRRTALRISSEYSIFFGRWLSAAGRRWGGCPEVALVRARAAAPPPPRRTHPPAQGYGVL
jgi:hypothetical protein